MPAMHRYVLADPVTDATIGRVPLTGVRYSRRINARGDLQASFPISNTRHGEIARLMTTRPLALYAERIPAGRTRGDLWWGGLVWTAQPQKDRRGATSCQLVGATFDSYPDHRFVWEGLVDGETELNFDDTDRGLVVANLWNHMQSRIGNANVRVDAIPVALGGDTWAGTWAASESKTYGDAITDVLSLDPAFEATVDVWADPNGTRHRALRMGDPLLGDESRVHLLTSPSNLVSWSWPVDHTVRGTNAKARGAAVDGALGGSVEPLQSPEVINSDLTNIGVLRVDVSHDYPEDDEEKLAGYAIGLISRGLPQPSVTVRLGDTSPISPGILGDSGRVVLRDVVFPDGVLDTKARVIGMQVTPATRSQAEEITFEFQPEDAA